MALTKEAKQEATKRFGKHATDTGSPEVQVAMLTSASTSSPSTCARTRRTTTRAAACSSWSAAGAGS